MESIPCFNSRASCEARRGIAGNHRRCRMFQFTRLLRGATVVAVQNFALSRFNSRASCEARQEGKAAATPALPFQFTRLLRGATSHACRADSASLFQFTRLLRGATPGPAAVVPPAPVSIHAPLARRDSSSPSRTSHFRVSIHAPLARRDIISDLSFDYLTFQFTRLLRGATKIVRYDIGTRSFNSRASCEARPRAKR